MMTNTAKEKPQPEVNRDFKGVWIPKELYLDTELSWTEKILIIEIDSLDNDPEKGCFASNAYLARFLGISEGTLANTVSRLKKKGYVRQLWFDGRNRGLATILRDARINAGEADELSRKGESSSEGSGSGESSVHEKMNSRKSEHSNTNNKVVSNTGYTHTDIAGANAEMAEAAKQPLPEMGREVPLESESASCVFQQQFDVALDRDSIDYINRAVPAAEIDLWETVCGDFYNGLNPQQKSSNSYKTKSVTFLLKDFRRESELRAKRRERENIVASEQAARRIERKEGGSPAATFSGRSFDIPAEPPRKTYFDYAEEKTWEDYCVLRDSMLQALEQMNKPDKLKKIDEVMEYDKRRRLLENREGTP